MSGAVLRGDRRLSGDYHDHASYIAGSPRFRVLPLCGRNFFFVEIRYARAGFLPNHESRAEHSKWEGGKTLVHRCTIRKSPAEGEFECADR